MALVSREEVEGALEPFTPDTGGMAELRKRLSSARPNRPDAGMDRYWMPHPFRVAEQAWSPLLHQLSSLPHRLTISVALEPVSLPPGLSAELDRLATTFARLAREGEMQSTGLYSGPVRLSPDRFAVDAEKAYSDLARRYRQRAFRYRVAVAAPVQLDEGILHLIGSTISPPDDARGESYLTRELSGDAYRIVRPATREEAECFATNLATASILPWGAAAPPASFERVGMVADVVDVTEASAIFRLPIAATGALPAFPVRRPTFAVRVEVRQTQSLLSIGEQVVGGHAEGDVGIPVDDLTMHAFVVGTTGSGKTTTVLRLCDELWRTHRVPFLVIEPVNTSGDDYRWFLDRQGFEDSAVLIAGEDAVAPLRLNPFAVPAGVRVGEHIANLLACFDAAFGLWDPLPAIYRAALEQTYLEDGFSLDDVGGDEQSWPTLERFISEMEQATENLEYAGEVRSNIIAASRVRVDQLRKGPVRSVFDCTHSTPLEAVLERPAVIELARVGAGNEQELALVMAVLLTMIAEHRRSQRASRKLTHVIVVEEAHKLLRNPDGGRSGEPKGDAGAASAKLFASLLAEIRKYGEGIVIADQDPAKLVSDAYKNTNLKIMHRLPHEADRQLVGASMRFDQDHLREAASLERHHAFVHAERFDRPALVRVPNIRAADARDLPSDSEIGERFRHLRASSVRVDASIAPYPECEGCSSVCLFRGRAAATAATRSVLERFGQLMSAWQPTAPLEDREIWWGELGAIIAGPQERATRAPADLEACTFMHLMRAKYRRDRLPWVKRFRARRTGAVAPVHAGLSG